MARRLFIDCDDTLVRYLDAPDEPHPYGIRAGERWEPDAGVVRAIERWMAHNPDGTVIVWSGGGDHYAGICADLILPDVDVVPMTKGGPSFWLVRPGDTVVDDMPETVSVSVPVLSPDEFSATSAAD